MTPAPALAAPRPPRGRSAPPLRAGRAALLGRLLLAGALALAAGAVSAEAPVPAPPRVTAVELVLPAGEDPEPARALLAVEAGEPLSARSLRRTVQRLFQTGRYRNVVVRALPDAAPPGGTGRWVRLVVEALPLRIVAEVRVAVEGGGVDEQAIRAAAGLAAGDRFDDGDLGPVERRIRAALARKGFRSPEVAARARGDLSVTVELAVRPGAPLRLGEVRLTGAPGSAAALLGETLTLRAGDVLDDEALEAGLRRLRAALHEAGHRRSRVGAPVVDVKGELARVEIPVDAGPRLVFAFRGNEQVAAPVLLREAGFEEGQPVDVPAVGAAVDRLVAFYRSRGHAAARVEAEEVRRGADLQVVFHVDEGLRYRVLPVRFEGAESRGEAWLRDRLAALLDDGAPEADEAEADRARALLLSVPGARPAPSPPPAVPPRAAWDEVAWARAVEELVDDYRADGFLEAIHLGTSVVLDARRRTAQVTVRLREGGRTHVDAISFEGNEAVSLPELARQARLAPGDPLVFERVEATRAAILRVYLSRGHLYARVEAREVLDRERRLAALRFVVSEGPKVRIGRIVVSGNRRTRAAVVRRALAFDEGGTYDPEAVQRSQAALLRLGVFRSVALRLQDPEVPQETKDVAVELAERPWATLTQGVGFSIANGPRAFVEYARPNLLGRALELAARAKVNYPIDEFRPDLAGKAPVDRVEGRADVGLRSASFSALSLPMAVRTDVIAEILHRKAYDLRRVTGVTGVDLGVTSRLGFSLQYELEVDRLAKSESAARFLTQADVERLRFDDGDTTLHAVRSSVTLDHRDNSAHPHRGWFAAASVEYARSLGGPGERILFGALPASDFHTNLLKAWGTASGYVPVGSATVLALSLRGGRVFPLDGRSRTIVPRRFFLGGASTMRGFAEDEMLPQDVRAELAAGVPAVSQGGEAFLLAKAELRLRLRGSVEAAFFGDVGNLWLDPDAYRLLDLRPNVGVGLRFVTPIGPAVFDLGFNVEPDDSVDERSMALHFTIGVF